DLMTALIDQLPRFDLFAQHFHHSVSNCLPFIWKGFEASVRYTYVIPELSNLDAVWGGFKDSVRRQIRKERQQVAIRKDVGVDRLIDLCELTFARQGKRLPATRDLIRRVVEACTAQGVGQVFFAEGADG